MLVFCNCLQFDGLQVRSRAGELAVGVDDLDVETPVNICVDSGVQKINHGGMRAIVNTGGMPDL